MRRTLLAHVEVVLLTWQQLPEELVALSADWVYKSRFYRIARRMSWVGRTSDRSASLST